MKLFFKYLFLSVLSIFLSVQVNASSTFFSIEKEGGRVYDLANKGDGLIPDVLKSARSRVRSTYGDDYVDIFLKQKFGNEQGAAAVIVDKFGTAGKRILDDDNIKTLSDAAKAIVRDKNIMRFYDQHMYRAVNETSYNFDKLKSTGIIDASPSQFPTYISLDNFTDAAKAKDVLQLPKKPTWVAEFTPDQVVKDIRFAKGKFNQGDYTEVLTQAYPKWGKGGGTQFLTNAEIKVSKLRNIETGEIIDFTHTLKRSYAAKGQGTDLIRETFSSNNIKIQIKSGHGFNRPHTTGDFSKTNLTMDKVEDAIIDDFDIRVSNGDNIPTVGSANFKGPANFILDVDGVSVGYRVVYLQNGSVSISTYWPN